MSDQSQSGSDSNLSGGEGSAISDAEDAYSVSQPRKQRTLELPPTQRIYIGNLFFEATEDSLKKFLDPIGEVQEIMIHRDRRGLSKGCVYTTQRTSSGA